MATKTEKPETSGHYDVFLSFRGPDTRKSFISFLFNIMVRHGVRVFLDEDEIPTGKKIDIILQAIENSDICMPVFSKTFAESKWCLREVSKMVELKKNVFPVFFEVSPDDVNIQTPVYRQYMTNHEINCGKDQVKQWEDALKEVSKIKGHELKDEGHWGFCTKLVTDIMSQLNLNLKDVPGNLVGMEDQVNLIMKSLDTESDGVRCVGIHGLPGVGKTSLARFIYDLFSPGCANSCFLANIRESSETKGMEGLQKELLTTLEPKLASMVGFDKSLQLITRTFRHNKVLIVLDDVHEEEHIEKLVGKADCFGPGSIIIVTTRDERALQVGLAKFDIIARLKGLNLEEALRLFSQHAFKADLPRPGFETLSSEIVSSCGGLPLALKVMGLRLAEKRLEVWEEMAKKLKKSPPQEVGQKFMVVYETLEPEIQQIFLDIACFFIHTGKRNPVYMWETSDFLPAAGLNVLESLSLIKIDENGFMMHDLLRDFGRELAQGRPPNAQSAKKCSRLWMRDEESFKGLSTTEKRDIVALRVDGSNAKSTGEMLRGMKNLRYLSIEDEKFGEKLKQPLPELKWLYWKHCPSSLNIDDMDIKKLTILEMPQSSIKENWETWRHKMLHLKVLDLTKCYKLKSTPDFSKIPNLERLTLSGCAKIKKLHGSIVQLNKLQFLDLQHCSSLAELPKEFGCLEKLEHLSLHGCRKLKKLPSSLGNLKSLATLDLSWRCDMSRAIVSLMVTGTSGRVDDDFYLGAFNNISDDSRLVPVKHLTEVFMAYQHPKLEEIPHSLGDLKTLTKLDLSHSLVSFLPDSFGHLESLQELTARWSGLRKLPKSIGGLKKLETILLEFSRSLTEIPEEIGGLSSLRTLNLIGTAICRLPPTITQLHLLQSLKFDTVGILTALPNTIADYSHLQELLLGCAHLSCIPPLPHGLRTLTLHDFHEKVKLPDVSNMSGFTHLTIYCKEEVPECGNLSCLSTSLTELCLVNFLTIPDLSHLTKLRKFVLMMYKSDRIPGLEKLESLQELRLGECNSIRSLDLSGQEKLKYLSVRWCLKLEAMDGLQGLALAEEDVHLSECSCSDCCLGSILSFRKTISSWFNSLGLSQSVLPSNIRQYLDSVDRGTHSWYSLGVSIKFLMDKKDLIR